MGMGNQASSGARTAHFIHAKESCKLQFEFLFNSTLWTFMIIVLAFFVLMFVASGIRILKEWERVAVLRLGKFKHIKGPGVIWIMPILDKVAMKVSLRLQTYAFKTERSLTRDNVPVVVDAVMYFRVIEVEKAILSVERYAVAVELAAQTTLREVIGKAPLDDLLAERDKIAAHLQEVIDLKTEQWGIKVTAVEIRDVVIPTQLQDAMSREAQAERERRARVTLAQAELEASTAMLQAARIYEESSVGFALRIWNVIQQISTNASLIMLVPTNIPEVGLSAGTAAAIAAGAGGLKLQRKKAAETES